MKRVLSSCSAALAAAWLSSCTAVHPLPEDVTDNTVTIVQKIRCEARDAVMAAIVRYLEDSQHPKDRAFALHLKADPRRITSLINARAGVDISVQAFKYLNQYYSGAIAYGFDLDIQKEADNGISLNIIDAFTNNDRKYDIGGGVKREQKARRQFQISDRFIDLANLYYPDAEGKIRCGGKREPNYAYPISGAVGLQETVSTFLELNDIAGIQQAPGGTGVTRFTDELAFTTTVTGRLNPKIVFDPVGITKANPDVGLTNTYKRIDKHQVTVAIEVPILVEPEFAAAQRKADNPKAATLRRSRTSELKALRNIDDQRTINALQNLENNLERPLE